MKVDQKIVGIFQELLDLASSVTQTRSSGGGKSEKEIDDLTIAQADDDSATRRGENPSKCVAQRVRLFQFPRRLLRAQHSSLGCIGSQASNTGLRKVIAERIDIEEAAFAHAKRDLATQ